ncbi:MAG: outer membrane protein assembly factor BamB family protein [Deltaproteobacteria bacterium]
MSKPFICAVALSLAAGCHAASGATGGTTGGGATSAGSTTGGSTSGSGTTGSSTSGAATTGSGTTGGAGRFDAGVAVLEEHGDPARDGVYVDSRFTKASVSGLTLSASFSPQVVGSTYAQPLYLAAGPGGRPALYVVDESDAVYAFDGESGAQLWKTQVATPMKLANLPCGDIDPLGITGTPVIDPASRTLLVAAMTSPDQGVTPKQQLFALSVDDGSIRWQLDLETSVPGFDSRVQNQRGPLLVWNGELFVPYGGFDGDCGGYHGWVLAVPLSNPTSATGFMTGTPDGGSIGAGIWGPSALAADSSGVFAVTGNTNPPYPEAWSLAESEAIIRLGAGARFSGAAADYFAPADWYDDDVNDLDLGSSGTVLFDVPGATPSHLAFAIGKTKNGYLVDAAQLGGVADGGATLPGASQTQVFGAMVAYRTATGSYVAFRGQGAGCPGDLTALSVSAASPPGLAEAWCASQNGEGSPIVTMSAPGKDVIVWGLGAGGGDGRLRAFDGDTGSLLYPSPALSGVEHWMPPIAANGHLYVAADTTLYRLDAP